jgi:predicted acyltransferase
MSAPGGRLASLDAFRGFTIASMILVNNPGSWSSVYAPLRHADWHGWTYTDTIFPFFLWIVGVAMTLSTARRLERGDGRGRLLSHAFRRAAIIFGLGLVLNGFPAYDLATLRIPGVLQRIAVCYLAAYLIFLFTPVRGQLLAAAALLAGYWGLMAFYPVPGFGAGVLEKQGNFAQYVDALFLTGHMYSQTRIWDPEGIVSTLPSIATVLFGALAGHLLRRPLAPGRRTLVLAAAGAGLALLGQLIDPWLPINKNLWTTSFALWMAGLAMLSFAAWYWVLDVRGWQRWARPFGVYGMNALTIYLLAGLAARTLLHIKLPAGGGEPISLWAWGYQTLFLPLASPVNASLLFAVVFVAALYLPAWLMYRRGWFLKA